MRISKISIQNYKCIGPTSITFDFSPDILILIGENNTGKSSVLDALKLFFSGSKTVSADLFHKKLTDKNHAISIEIEFNEISDNDQKHKISSYIYKDKGAQKIKIKKEYFYNAQEKCQTHYYAWQDNKWKQNPGGFSQNVDDLFTNEKMQVIKVEAVKKVEEEVVARGDSAFHQIFNMVIKEELHNNTQYKNLLRAIDNYSSLFSGSKQLNSIKNLELDISNRLKRIVGETVSKITSMPPQNIDSHIMPTPKLFTNDSSLDISPEHQGNGLQRVLIFCLLELLAEKKSPLNKEVGPRNLILIEEPEIYMHPQMERKVSDTLYNLAHQQYAQIICTTHSPVFINMKDSHRSLCRITKNKNGQSVVTQIKDEIFDKHKDKSMMKKYLRMLLTFDPSVNEVFFAKRVVLLEGDTEMAVLQEGAELLKIFNQQNIHKKRDTTLINCRGKWTILAFQEVLNKLKIDYCVIHDQDDDDDNSGATGKIFKLLNNQSSRRMVFIKNIEDHLQIQQSNKNKPFKAILRIRELNKQNLLDQYLGKYIRFAYGIT